MKIPEPARLRTCLHGVLMTSGGMRRACPECNAAARQPHVAQLIRAKGVSGRLMRRCEACGMPEGREKHVAPGG